jgi:hypothetical protein
MHDDDGWRSDVVVLTTKTNPRLSLYSYAGTPPCPLPTAGNGSLSNASRPSWHPVNRTHFPVFAHSMVCSADGTKRCERGSQLAPSAAQDTTVRASCQVRGQTPHTTRARYLTFGRAADEGDGGHGRQSAAGRGQSWLCDRRSTASEGCRLTSRYPPTYSEALFLCP